MRTLEARSIVGMLAFAAATLAAGTNARADATLELTPVSSQCSTTTWGAGPGGASFNETRSWACDPSPTAPVTLGNGRSFTYPSGFRSWMQVVYDFTYTDDGLPLQQVERLDGLWRVSSESGVITAQVDIGSGGTVDLSVSGVLPPDGFFQSGDMWLVLGLNDHPDRISGRLTIDISPIGEQGSTRITDIDVRGSVASVSAIPEPSTWALLILGLAPIAFAARRGQHAASGHAVAASATA